MWHSIRAACPWSLLNLDSFLAFFASHSSDTFEDHRTGICRLLQLGLPDVPLPFDSGPAPSVESRRALPVAPISGVPAPSLSRPFSGFLRCSLTSPASHSFPSKSRRIRVFTRGVFITQFKTFSSYRHHFDCIHFHLELCCLISK